ncbi:hypothetical protein FDECE_11429 [Fusarium decemcellulare]|nr:hypothetical protein FDECE_11429 [Fusarium decemcellulare]
MVSNAWRVRFAPSSHAHVTSRPEPAPAPAPTAADTSVTLNRRQLQSKAACQECKLRRAKCDEAYPVCRHCARCGTVCVPAPRKNTWNLRVPLLIRQAGDSSYSSALLQYYFERVCHIMVLDPEVNPLALPLLGLF